jgi:drug/metabolite transporter (DMT)-like permease
MSVANGAVERAALAPRMSGGVWLALVSAATFGTSGAFAKSLIEAGWSPGAAVTARITLGALLLLVPAMVVLRGRWYLIRRNAGLLTAYGVSAMAGCQLFFFNAVTTLSVGVALLLEYLAPVLVVVWLWLRHGQRPRTWTITGILLAMGGLLLILDLAGGMRIDLGGVLWGLAAACGLACYFVLSARETGGLPPLVLAAGGMLVAAVALGLAGALGLMPMTVGAADVALAGVQMHWLVPVLGLALVAASVAYATGIAATRRLGPKIASFFGLTEILFTVLFAWLLLGELPLPIQLTGGVLVVAGVLAVRYDEFVGGRRSAAPLREGSVLDRVG